jgi:hypothetical protein
MRVPLASADDTACFNFIIIPRQSDEGGPVPGGVGPAVPIGAGRHPQARAIRAVISCHKPECKTPAIVNGEVIVFDSQAIQLYLDDKTGRFLP